MKEHERPHADQERRRELAVHRYVRAFDQGDLDTLEEIACQAETDPELDRQLAGVNAALHAEAGLPPVKEPAQGAPERLGSAQERRERVREGRPQGERGDRGCIAHR